MKRLAFKYSYAVHVGHYRKMTARARAETSLDAEREALLGTHDTIESQKRRWINGGPDCLVSWLVAFANFIINFLVVGLGRMSGILYIVFMQMFHADRQTASVPFSVQQAARNLFGPLAGILGQKYGVRSVTVVGGVIGALSVGGCYFVKDINSITLLWE
ncbi:uncharacterized protein CEXT_480661 [Caerostris extrusa]|uniref:Major facilitator superfamily (MFS) profile domain-containing protein n=1 Tax=Caerostris extrusa TaxID=172846 RepID=A0AAV4N8C6_CAEEX|nr:uncharacterized protein CEXT_480661 [Caerostris extrusa]